MLELIATLNLIVAVQSLFLSAHFGLKRKGLRELNRIMAVLMFAFSAVLYNTYYSLNDLSQSVLLQDFANNVMWFVGPSLYLYVIVRDQPADGLFSKHYAPFLLPAVFDLSFDFSWYDNFIPLVAFCQMGIYLYFAIRNSLQDFRDKLSYYSWILPVLAVFALLVLANAAMALADGANLFYVPTTVRQSFTTLMAFPVFYLSYKEMNASSEFGIQREKYQATKLPQEKIDAYLEGIQTALVKEKIFQKQALTLGELSQRTEIPAKYISQIINQELGLSFTDYLLQLRIEEAKTNLLNPAKQHLSIAGIAADSGFASTSRFNHTFKKVTGQTPSEFRKS